MPVVDANITANYSLVAVTHKLNFTSQPPVNITVKVGANAPVVLGNGQSLDVPEGETIEVTAPSEVIV